MAAPIEVATRGVPVSLLASVTTGTGIAKAVPNNCFYNRFNVKGEGTISAGNLIVEEASDPNYAGLWSQLATIDLTTLSGNKAQTYHALGSMSFIRARISVDLTGGGTTSVDWVSAG